MENRFKWAALLGAMLIAIGVGIVSYNAGVVHGQALTTPPSSSAPMPVWPPFYGFHPWGFGFLGPFVFAFFWLFALRFLFWGGLHRRGWYYGNRYDASDRFEEWHRRAHERMNAQPPSRS